MTVELVNALLTIAMDAIRLAREGGTITSADVSREITKLKLKLDAATDELQRIHASQWAELGK